MWSRGSHSKWDLSRALKAGCGLSRGRYGVGVRGWKRVLGKGNHATTSFRRKLLSQRVNWSDSHWRGTPLLVWWVGCRGPCWKVRRAVWDWAINSGTVMASGGGQGVVLERVGGPKWGYWTGLDVWLDVGSGRGQRETPTRLGPLDQEWSHPLWWGRGRRCQFPLEFFCLHSGRQVGSSL